MLVGDLHHVPRASLPSDSAMIYAMESIQRGSYLEGTTIDVRDLDVMDRAGVKRVRLVLEGICHDCEIGGCREGPWCSHAAAT